MTLLSLGLGALKQSEVQVDGSVDVFGWLFRHGSVPTGALLKRCLTHSLTHSATYPLPCVYIPPIRSRTDQAPGS